ncbi:amidohydrolase [Phenylobacterium montanum]|uniref:Amidohydrolase n=1 Tax=Phenylobacterium montanum TaxID=2823693 RepID=A0A975G4N3_9CAUL|nr:amidohydrolase [Caulobacter sp. S6]QUD90462.1 amidohydrolase [Caulobacter sp. S6]
MVRIKGALLASALAATGFVAHAQTASLILTGGKVWTENPAQPEAQAIAIAGDKVLLVGGDAAVKALVGPGTQVIDLKGRRVTPGFNDAHVHFIDGGDGLASVQLGDANSQAEFRARVAAFAKTLPKGAWLRNGNWDHQRWSPAELPTHRLIDDVTPDNPALLWRLDGHMVLVNALAMKLAGIDRSTKDPPGGEIVRDAKGEPTGVLKDAATDLVERVMPALTPKEMDAALTAAMAEAAKNGVTSVQNLANSSTDKREPQDFREFEKFDRAGKLTVRIYTAGRLQDWKDLAGTGISGPFGDAMLRLGDVKGFADGALGSTTAWMNQPFVGHPGYSGIASSELVDPDRMYANMKGADQAGLQLAVHAIGDKANHEILDLYERLQREDGPADRRLRIEHAQHLDPADIPRFARLHVIASMQPYHAIDDGRWAETILGPERIKTSYAWRSLLDAGAVLAFGSDWAVAPLEPLMGVYAATTRRTLDGKTPGGWVPEQRISVAEAVHAYTVGSAYAEFQEKVKGSLEPGKLADLVVLSDDIFKIPPEQIAKTRVDLTIVGGKIVYDRR